MKSSEILKNATLENLIVRVYEANTEIVVMGAGSNDLAEGSNFAVLAADSGNFQDYVNEDHPVLTDDTGATYTEWLNSDFETPFDSDDIEERIAYYESHNN